MYESCFLPLCLQKTDIFPWIIEHILRLFLNSAGCLHPRNLSCTRLVTAGEHTQLIP